MDILRRKDGDALPTRPIKHLRPGGRADADLHHAPRINQPFRNGVPEDRPMSEALAEIILRGIKMRIYMQQPDRLTKPLRQRTKQGKGDAMFTTKGKQMGKAYRLFFDHGEAFLDVAKCNVEFAKIGKIEGCWISAADRMSAICQHARRSTDGARAIACAGAVGGANIQRHAGHAKASASIMGASAQK